MQNGMKAGIITCMAMLFSFTVYMSALAGNDKVYNHYPLYPSTGKAVSAVEIKTMSGGLVESISPEKVVRRGIPHPWGAILYAFDIPSTDPQKYHINDELTINCTYQHLTGYDGKELTYENQQINEKMKVVKIEGNVIICLTKTPEQINKEMRLATT